MPQQIFNTAMKKTQQETLDLVDKLGIKLAAEDKELHEKQLLKVRGCRVLLYLPSSVSSDCKNVLDFSFLTVTLNRICCVIMHTKIIISKCVLSIFRFFFFTSFF